MRLFKIFIFLFPLLLFIYTSVFSETIWVTDYGPEESETKKLIKVLPNGTKKLIELKDFANPTAIEVDQKDGSVWVTDLTETFNNQIVKLSREGHELYRLNGFVRLGDAAIDAKDGSYFVSDRMIGEVIKVSGDGKEVFRIRNLSPVKDLEGMGCLKNTEGCHLAYTGMEVNLEGIDDVGISPVDSSIWIADTGNKRLLKFDKDGKKLTQKRAIGEPEHLDIAFDGTCWVNNIERGRVFKISQDGKRILAKIAGLYVPFELSVSPIDNTCWVTTASEIVQISADGEKILKRTGGFEYLEGLSIINPQDGSFWVADAGAGEIIKLSRHGQIITRIGGFERPRFLEVYWDTNN